MTNLPNIITILNKSWILMEKIYSITICKISTSTLWKTHEPAVLLTLTNSSITYKYGLHCIHCKRFLVSKKWKQRNKDKIPLHILMGKHPDDSHITCMEGFNLVFYDPCTQTNYVFDQIHRVTRVTPLTRVPTNHWTASKSTWDTFTPVAAWTTSNSFQLLSILLWSMYLFLCMSSMQPKPQIMTSNTKHLQLTIENGIK